MRIAVALFTCLIVSSFALAAGQKSSGETSVTLKRLLEKREITLDKTPFSGWDNGVELYVHVDGAGVKDARKYKLKVTDAKDDAGTDLKKVPKGVPDFEQAQFQEARPPQTFGFDDDKKPKPTGFDVEVRLRTPPARSAKTISVRGEMQVLAGGEKKLVQTKQLKKMVGKTIDDPALKAVGVTITVLDPDKPSLDAVVFGGGKNGGKSLPLQLAGNLDAIAELRFLDDKGKSINNGSMSRSDQPADKKTIAYELSKPLDDDTVLEVEVWPGQRTVKVPFDLKDLKLP